VRRTDWLWSWASTEVDDLMNVVPSLSDYRTASVVARRGYADVAEGGLKLSLALPHQVRGFQRDAEGITRLTASFI
jgi:hypothetical protein